MKKVIDEVNFGGAVFLLMGLIQLLHVMQKVGRVEGLNDRR